MFQAQRSTNDFLQQSSAINAQERDAATQELNSLLDNTRQAQRSRVATILQKAGSKACISLISLGVTSHGVTILEARITDEDNKSHVLVAMLDDKARSLTFDTLHFLANASMLNEPIFIALFNWLRHTASRILPTETITSNKKAISITGIDWSDIR